MDIKSIQKIYRRYARGYDVYFGALLQPGREAIIEKMGCRPGDRILEVGVGTGLSLPLYPRDVHVAGIDVSREMLARARARKNQRHLDNVTALRLMDAESMQFPDDSFDKVVAMYVVSVAPHPARLVSEMRRVCRPGGELFIVNHFQHANPVVGGLERLFAPLSRVMGFHPDFSLEDFLHETGLDVVERTPVNVLGYWTLLRARSSNTTAERGTSRAAAA